MAASWPKIASMTPKARVVDSSSAPSASAPLTISMISVVIESWRARFMMRLSVLISSSALSVAAFIARWRKACSDAAALSRAA